MPPGQRIDFRIGIHLSDVVEESDGDLMGDGVNIAARLEGIANPGAICLSEDAFRQLKGRLESRHHRSRPNPIEEYRGTGASLFAASLRSCPGKTGSPDRAQCGGEALGRAFLARQAFDRRLAVPEHEWRPRAGLFRRWDCRGDHHWTFSNKMAVPHLLQLNLHIQGKANRREGRRPGAWGALCPRRERTAVRQPVAGDGATDRERDRQTSLGGSL